MKRIPLIALAAFITTAANAADAYSPSSLKDAPIVSGPANWTGFYVGVNGGYGQGSTGDVGIAVSQTGPFAEDSDKVYTRGATVAAPGATYSGFLYGVQGEYLYQIPNSIFVLGAGVSFDGTSITGASAGTPIATYSDTVPGSKAWASQDATAIGVKYDYLLSVTGKVGVAFGNWLPYVRGGFVSANVEQTAASSIGDGFIASRNATDTGWTIGGGVDWKVAQNWSIFAEYSYNEFGKHALTYADTAPAINYPGVLSAVTYKTTSFDENLSIVKAGVNYNVSSVYQPLK